MHLTNSPYAKLHSVPVRAVTIEEGFWAKRRKTNVERSIPPMRFVISALGVGATIATSKVTLRMMPRNRGK